VCLCVLYPGVFLTLCMLCVCFVGVHVCSTICSFVCVCGQPVCVCFLCVSQHRRLINRTLLTNVLRSHFMRIVGRLIQTQLVCMCVVCVFLGSLTLFCCV